MNFEKIEQILVGEPEFRKKQVKQLVFCDLIENWNQATTLPVELRKILEKECPLKINAEIFKSKESQSVKTLISLGDGLKIESVLMCHKDRNTVCVSSQIGCPLGCVFCATGKIGFKRNLNQWEIVEQVLYWARLLALERSDGGQARWLKKEAVISPFVKGGLRGILKNKSTPPLLFQRRGENKINNIVFMGMGEPFLNYDNVLSAVKILNDKEGFNLGARHFSISTCGITEGIQRLAQEKLEINLAISLNAPNDELRSKIMPCNKQYPVNEIFKAVDNYINKTRRRVMVEYIMIEDMNDSDECARELAKIVKRPLCFVNLISYNPTGIFKASEESQIKKFKKILEEQNVAVTRRWRFGSDINAACGQLVGGRGNK